MTDHIKNEAEVEEDNMKVKKNKSKEEYGISRLENFINGDIESFIMYISARIQNLEESVPYVNQIDQA